METETVLSEVIGESYPVAVALPNGRLRRNWVVRTVSPLPDNSILDGLRAVLEETASKEIGMAYSAVAEPAALQAAHPCLLLLRLDEHHLIVRIEFSGPQDAIGDSAAISQWGILQALDRKLPVEELQGLPRVLWFPFRGEHKP